MRLTDLKQLYYFSLVYQEQNLSKAANKAFITQSALSQQLIKLEQHYGIALFERRQSHMLPTEFAEHIYPQVSQLIRDADALEKSVRHYHGGNQQQIRIGMVQSVEPVINNLLRYTLSQPALSITITEAPVAHLLAELTEHKLDMVIGQADPALPPNIEKQPFCDDELMVVLPPTHPLATHKEICVQQLRDQHLILLPEPHITHSTLLNLASEQDIALKITATLSQITAILAAVNSRLGLTVLPATAMQLQPDTPLIWRRLADVYERQPIWIYYHGGQSQDIVLQNLINSLLTPCCC